MIADELTLTFMREAFPEPTLAEARLAAIRRVLRHTTETHLDPQLLQATLNVRLTEYTYDYSMNALQQLGLLQGVLVETSWSL